MLFHGKKHKKLMDTIWMVIGFLVIISMILLYAPMFL
jgi:hypothetical protein